MILEKVTFIRDKASKIFLILHIFVDKLCETPYTLV